MAKLAAQYKKLEGYQTSYKTETPNGIIGILKVGVDFKSGWAYSHQDIKYKDGKAFQTSQQWATGERDIIMKNGENIIVFEGFDDLSTRYSQLATVLDSDNEASLLRIAISSHITEVGGEFGISISGHDPDWLRNIVALTTIKDQKAHLDWGENGAIVVDQKTGLLLSQEITVKEGKRVMKVIDSNKCSWPISSAGN